LEILQSAIELTHIPPAKAGPVAYRRSWGWEVIVTRDILDAADTLYVELSPTGKLLCEVGASPSEPPGCHKQW
jgi:hypothetical protein